MACSRKLYLQVVYKETIATHKAVVSEYPDHALEKLEFDTLLQHKKRLKDAVDAAQTAKKAYARHIVEHGC